MAANLTKSRAPDLSPTPEEPIEADTETFRTSASRNRSGLNLQERLLACGNFNALLDIEDRMGRRPSTSSLGIEGSMKENAEEDHGYFNLKRVGYLLCLAHSLVT